MRPFPVVELAAADAGAAARRELARRIDQICRETGFLAVRGHGVPEALVERMWATTRAFFDAPEEVKRRVAMPYAGYPYGYAPLAAEALARSRGASSPPDRKASFSIGPRDFLPADELGRTEGSDDFRGAANLWPDEPAELRAVWSEYYRTMAGLAARLLRLFALALDLPEGFFEDKIDRHVSALRALDYPACDAPPEGEALRAGAHSDYGTLTILLPEPGSTGLEILTAAGRWEPVPSLPDALVVNLGDLMARWTNDRWTSTLHRVRGPRAGPWPRRQSIAFFHMPNWDARIACLPGLADGKAPPRYPPVLAGPYLREKFLSAVEPGGAEPPSPSARSRSTTRRRRSSSAGRNPSTR